MRLLLTGCHRWWRVSVCVQALPCVSHVFRFEEVFYFCFAFSSTLNISSFATYLPYSLSHRLPLLSLTLWLIDYHISHAKCCIILLKTNLDWIGSVNKRHLLVIVAKLTLYVFIYWIKYQCHKNIIAFRALAIHCIICASSNSNLIIQPSAWFAIAK